MIFSDWCLNRSQTEYKPLSVGLWRDSIHITSLLNKPDTVGASQWFSPVNEAAFQNSTPITLLLEVHIQGWVQLLFSIPERGRCEQRSPGSHTGSSHLKYLCSASLRLCPIRLMHYLIRTSGLAPDLLLMSYRFSLHPLHYHQIFSTYRLGLMHRGPSAEFKLLISGRKLGWKKKALLIKVVKLANLQAFNLISTQFGCHTFRRLEWKLSEMSLKLQNIHRHTLFWFKYPVL